MAGSRTHWFADQNLTDQTSQLTGDNIKRARALRLRVGESIVVTDGLGTLTRCEVIGDVKGELRFEQLARSTVSRPPVRTIVQALTKHDSVESALRLATEFGATRFVPWQSERSIVRWDSAQATKQRERLTAVAIDQSLLNHLAWFPSVESLARRIPAPGGEGFALSPDAEETLSQLIQMPNSDSVTPAITLLIGPEGGLTDAELEQAQSLGYVPASLGAVSYRSASASAAALALVGARTMSS